MSAYPEPMDMRTVMVDVVGEYYSTVLSFGVKMLWRGEIFDSTPQLFSY